MNLNSQSYIESGILEMFALDQLDANERVEVEQMLVSSPEIKAEFDSIQDRLEKYAALHAIEPSSRVKEKFKQHVSNLEKEKVMNLNNLPLISDGSDHLKWLELVKELLPDKVGDDETFTSILHQSDKLVQLLVVTSANIGDETHDESHESFLILQGRCKCTVGNEVRFMHAGDYMAIPLYEHHDVEILDKVVAILQHVAV